MKKKISHSILNWTLTTAFISCIALFLYFNIQNLSSTDTSENEPVSDYQEVDEPNNFTCEDLKYFTTNEYEEIVYTRCLDYCYSNDDECDSNYSILCRELIKNVRIAADLNYKNCKNSH